MSLTILFCLAFPLCLLAVAGRFNERPFPHRRIISRHEKDYTLVSRADACTLGAWQCAGNQLQRESSPKI